MKLAGLSFAQERLWFIEQMGGARAGYHLGMAWRISGELDAEALEGAWLDLCGRHSPLRTCFETAEGAPRARILEAGPPMERLEWGGAAEELVGREMRRAWDLRAEAPARLVLARRGGGEWLLVFVAHHIAFDGWSQSILNRELGALYEARRRGEAAELGRVEESHEEYARRQRAELTEEELDRRAAPWIDRLSGAPPLRLPAPAMAVVEEAPAEGLVFRVGETLAGQVAEFSRRQRVTASAVYLAAFEALLARYAGQDDFAVATAYANRDSASTEQLIGFFANLLVLRADLETDPSFVELVRQVGESTLDALNLPAMPFEKLVERLRPERDDAQTPLAHAIFTYQNFPIEGLRLEGAEVREMGVKPLDSIADFSLSLAPVGEDVEGQVRYSGARVCGAVARRMTENYPRLLRNLLRRPEQPVSKVEFISSLEREWLLEVGRGPASRIPAKALHRVFEEVAENQPESPALICREGEVSYAELNARANRLARLLVARGVERGGAVGVLMNRSAELVVAWLAVLKCGCSYVPLEPGGPQVRVARQLADCGARVLIAAGPVPGAIAAAVATVLEMSDEPDAAGGMEAGNLEYEAGLDEAACVMFSSGSTGQPKGASIRHRSILRLLFENGFARFEASDRFAFLAPPSFDASTLEVWGALAHGGAAVVVESRVAGIDEIERAVNEHGVTVLWLTSSLFNTVIDERPEALAGLRLLMTGGEALSVRHVRRAMEALPSTRLVNGYGPTENTTFTTCWEIERNLSEGARSVPIGRPIAGTSVYVVGESGALAPVGACGELCAGGDGVALGYAGGVEATKARFVADPWGEGPEAVMYRTGDRARWLEEGVLEFAGRRDDQVKIRGFRVEPGEVEAALGQHEAVGECCVVVRDEAPGGKCLAAYYSVRREARQESGEEREARLREHLRASVPAFMMPKYLVEVARLPLLASGKVDRAALPQPQPGGKRTHGEAPRPGLETKLAELWRGLLKVESVSRTDSFFDLGGHSLASVRLTALIEKQLGVTIAVSQVFAAPVLKDLAAHLLVRPATPAAAIPLKPAGELTRVLALSSGPRMRNLIARLEPGRGADGVPAPDPAELRHPCACEDLAEWYADWIRGSDDRGPWLLAAWCLVGAVAFDAALRLQEHGRGALVLLDSPCPTTQRDGRGVGRRMMWAAGRVAHHGARLLAGPEGGARSYIASLLQTRREDREQAEFSRQYRAACRGERPEAAVKNIGALVNHAALEYTPRGVLEWPVLLVRASEQSEESSEDWGWGRYAPRLEVRWAPGDHSGVFDAPHVERTSELVREWLGGIQDTI